MNCFSRLTYETFSDLFLPCRVAVALPVSIPVLRHVQVLDTKHLQLQKPRLPLPLVHAVGVRAGLVFPVRVHRPPEGGQEAHAVLPRQSPHPLTAVEGGPVSHPSRERAVSLSAMCVPQLVHLRREEAHHSQASGQFGGEVHWLPIKRSRTHHRKDLLLQSLSSEHGQPGPDVASHAGGTVALLCQHAGPEYDIREQELHYQIGSQREQPVCDSSQHRSQTAATSNVEQQVLGVAE